MTGDGRWQISSGGGAEPAWNPNGRELFFRSGNRLMAAGVTLSPNFAAEPPRVLFETPTRLTFHGTADGQRFLMGQADRGLATVMPHVMLNWTEVVRRRAGKQ